MSIEQNRTKIPIESIEYIRMQSNDCDSFVEHNRISIESEILGKIWLRLIDIQLLSIDIRLRSIEIYSILPFKLEHFKRLLRPVSTRR